MTLKEFGKIVREIREQELKLQQKEMAEELKVQATMVSRLEIGLGGRIDFVFQILDYFDSKGLNSYMIFAKPFHIENIQKKELTNNDQLIELLSALKRNNAFELEKIILMFQALS